ncbi:hypothetical protein NKK52_30300 [Mesorhizobium sp. C277A]|uniref:hypothetical protein n=1 Tax=Mesorhizobium sp. C277A TaxID=2956827 RepID=UPI0004CFBCD0|nr:hypothetical protein [Mesorhizobium sp. LSJC277A00]
MATGVVAKPVEIMFVQTFALQSSSAPAPWRCRPNFGISLGRVAALGAWRATHNEFVFEVDIKTFFLIQASDEDSGW